MSDRESIASRILGSRKYRDLHPKVVSRQIEELADRYDSPKELEQVVRRKLHQAFGAYLEGNWLRKFKAGVKEMDPDQPESAVRVSRRLMELHTSTRERVGILDDFCELIADVIPEDSTVLDVACGLNALTLPAIRERRRLRYVGVDLHKGMVDQMALFSEAANLEAEFLWDDILSASLPESDVAMILKLLPCLDHQGEGAALDLIKRIQAPILLISYPTRSLGGTNVGMETNYGMQLEQLASEAGRSVEGYTSATEAFYVLK
jgi:16S rRNA (guanine(1405)-N(7))-methyltransferase